jgi:hypothetical protein
MKPPKNTLLTHTLSLAISLLLPTLGSAATILLTNADFASGDGQAATGWTLVDGAGSNNSPSNYAMAIAASAYASGVTSRTMNIKSDGGNYVQQTLTTSDLGTVDAGTFSSYTIGLDYGYRSDSVRNGNHTIRLSLWNVTDNVEITGTDQVITDPGSVTLNVMNAGSYTLSYDNTALAGKSIAFRMTSMSGDLGSAAWLRTAIIDNVAITAVPEPAATLLGSIGLLALLRRRRA